MRPERTRVLLGPPGTGKTTATVAAIESVLKRGCRPDRIAVVTFTRAARDELLGRLEKEFQLGARDLPYLGTIHAVAFRLLGLHSDSIMDERQWRKFGEAYGYQFSTAAAGSLDYGGAALIEGRGPDDELRLVHDWRRNHGLPADGGLAACPTQVPRRDLAVFESRLDGFKKKNDLLEFPDILDRALDEGVTPDVDVAFIDEAQDLSPAQIRLVERWFDPCRLIVVAGDDDQAIYTFAGADPAWLVELARSSSTRVLDRSHRVPTAIHAVATKVISRNTCRVAKNWAPAPRKGRVTHIDAGGLGAWADGSVPTFVLARNRRYLWSAAETLFAASVPYVVEGGGAKNPLGDGRLQVALRAAAALRAGAPVDAAELRVLVEYVPTAGADLLPFGFKRRVRDLEGMIQRKTFETLLGRGTLLGALRSEGLFSVFRAMSAGDRRYLARLASADGKLPTPAVTLMTIHGAKGRQAHRVIVLPDMTRTTFDVYRTRQGGEAETRVFYVAVTRAVEELVLVSPRGRRRFEWRLRPERSP